MSLLQARKEITSGKIFICRFTSEYIVRLALRRPHLSVTPQRTVGNTKEIIHRSGALCAQLGVCLLLTSSGTKGKSSCELNETLCGSLLCLPHYPAIKPGGPPFLLVLPTFNNAANSRGLQKT
jgi:hypothetical protein